MEQSEEASSTSPKKEPKMARGEKEDAKLIKGGKGEATRTLKENSKGTQKEVDELIGAAERSAQEVLRRRSTGPLRAPLKVHYKGKVRNFCDGLGNCSPGLRPAGSRFSSRSEQGQICSS